MKKEIGIRVVNEPIYVRICDNCEKETKYNDLIKWTTSYNDGWDASFRESFEVCSLDCLKQFMKKEAYRNMENSDYYLPNEGWENQEVEITFDSRELVLELYKVLGIEYNENII